MIARKRSNIPTMILLTTLVISYQLTLQERQSSTALVVQNSILSLTMRQTEWFKRGLKPIAFIRTQNQNTKSVSHVSLRILYPLRISEPFWTPQLDMLRIANLHRLALHPIGWNWTTQSGNWQIALVMQKTVRSYALTITPNCELSGLSPFNQVQKHQDTYQAIDRKVRSRRILRVSKHPLRPLGLVLASKV